MSFCNKIDMYLRELLFSDTIGDNIAFGNVNATEKQIEFAAQQAMVKENILNLKKIQDYTW